MKGRGGSGDSAAAPSRSFRRIAPFLVGLNAQVAQLLLLREALILSNGSETALGICLGAWALCNGAGVAAAGALERAGFRPGRLFSTLLIILPLLLALSLHVTRIARSFTVVSGSENLPVAAFLFLALLAVGPVSLVSGFLFLSGMRRLFGRAGSGGEAASFYGIESLGSLAGGLVFSFLLVILFDPFTVAGLLLAVDLLLAGRGRSRIGRLLPLAGPVVGAAALLLGPALDAASERARWAVLQPGMTLVDTRESPYRHLALLSHGGEMTLFENGGLLGSLRSRPPERFGDWDRALFAHFALLQHPDPKTVLLLGGGVPGGTTDILLYGPERVDRIEPDRELRDLVREHLVAGERAALDDPRVLPCTTDGRLFLARSPAARYDLILADLADPINAGANRFYTREFFEQCRRVLRDGGAFVFTLSSQPTVIGEGMLERNGSILGALESVFFEILITPGETAFVAASIAGGQLTGSAETLEARYEARRIETPRFDPALFYTRFEAGELARVNRTYRERLAGTALAPNSRKFVPNSDVRPVAYFRDYLIRRRITGEAGGADRLDRWLTGKAGREPPLLWIPLLFPLAGLAALCALLFLDPRGRAGRGARRALLLATVAAAGFGGIALEVAILLAYQAVAGHLYGRMGVIIACYMCGMALGALLGAEKGSLRRPFLFACVCAAAGAAACLVVPRFGMRPGMLQLALPAFAGASLLVGAAGGLLFRGAVLALDRGGRSPGGAVYFFDISGTSLGGLVAGSVLVPLLGMAETVVLAGGILVVLSGLAIAGLTISAARGASP